MPRWTALLRAAPAAALLLGIAFAPDRAAAGDIPAPALTSYGPIARAALSYVGKSEGQCYEFARKVVLSVTGRRIGYDYRGGYFEAGAVEVSAAEARDGDVIQVAKDSDTNGGADYPGLHTAIILENLGGGRFNVVDSNAQFDGIVRRRLGYQPGLTASPGLSYHIYRFPSGGGTGPATAPAVAISTPVPAPPALEAGMTVPIAADGDCLRVRSAAGTDAAVVGCLPTGASVSVIEVGMERDGFRWVLVSGGGLRGWVAGNYLGKATAAAVTDAPAPDASGAAPPEVAAPPPPAAFAEPPVFSDAGHAVAVFMGGTVEELRSLATDTSASGVWVQDRDGDFRLMLVGGPDFMLEAFKANFPERFASPIAVTLVADGGAGADTADAPIADAGEGTDAGGDAGSAESTGSVETTESADSAETTDSTDTEA